MTRKLLAPIAGLVLVAGLALSGAVSAKPSNFCQLHPTNPNCVSPTPTPSPSGYPGQKLLFGLGTEADGAINNQMVHDAPIHLLSSWFNGHGDLSWMGGWHQSVLNWYSQGFKLHLIMYDTSADVTNQTIYGPACGKSYALSQTVVDDATALAQVFAGGTYYVTVFTEFQTNPCSDNQWVGNENYFRALQDNYLRILSAFHATGGKVSLGWGGWQWSWDDPANGGGRSLFPYFDSVMRASDFQSFQAMMNTGDGNIDDIPNMTSILSTWGPVMLAHHMPDSGACAVFNTDVHAIFTDSYINDVTSKGLFAWSFMEPNCWDVDSNLYSFVKTSVQKYGV